jgi:hypothetical protein
MECSDVPKMRGKFKIDEVTRTDYAEKLKFSAGYGGDKNSEDNTYSAATPTGSIELSITNKALWGKFNPGEKYYIDFTRAGS